MEQLRMLLLSVLVFGCLSGVLGTSKICQLLAHKACHSENLPEGIPATREEIVKACAIYQKVDECITNDLKTCHQEDKRIGSNDREWLDLRQINMEIYAQICHLTPDTYSKFLSNWQCMRNVSRDEFGDDSCGKTARKVIPALQKRIERLLEGENATFISLYDNCLLRLIEKNCLSDLHYKKCGSDSRDVALQLLKKFEDWDVTCPLVIRIDILELLDDLTSLTRKEIVVKNFLITDALF